MDVDDVQEANDVQAAIELSLANGPGYAEQLLASGMSAVALEGDLIIRLSPEGTRTVLGTLAPQEQR